ncbi:MAG: T9SS type A sorting domain-containing protein [Prolixibacteraceae bacterium]|nr:T9SS type A sorting domain-containing protein [Prolixibacteraceae bacterium]
MHYEWRGTHNYIDYNSSGSEVHFQTIDGPLPYGTYIYVKGTNVCGESAEYSKYLWVKDCGSNNIPAVVRPNPASSEVEISILSKSEESSITNDANFSVNESINNQSKEKPEKDRYTVLIVDLNGNPFYQKEIKIDKSIKINVSSWKEGIYYVIITSGENIGQTEFIIER